MSWIDDYDLHSPVLADRGWGLGVARPAMPDDYAYPTSIVVRPDGTVMQFSAGFGGWDAFAELIRADVP